MISWDDLLIADHNIVVILSVGMNFCVGMITTLLWWSVGSSNVGRPLLIAHCWIVEFGRPIMVDLLDSVHGRSVGLCLHSCHELRSYITFVIFNFHGLPLLYCLRYVPLSYCLLPWMFVSTVCSHAILMFIAWDFCSLFSCYCLGLLFLSWIVCGYFVCFSVQYLWFLCLMSECLNGLYLLMLLMGCFFLCFRMVVGFFL